jgi:hypothetical protein
MYRRTADAFSDPEVIKQRLGTVTIRRKELELLREVNDKRKLVADEIQRLKERELCWFSVKWRVGEPR